MIGITDKPLTTLFVIEKLEGTNKLRMEDIWFHERIQIFLIFSLFFSDAQCMSSMGGRLDFVRVNVGWSGWE